ncbi:MAG: Na+/H+ antiporter subunit E [Candidatus Competibacteraceae bacterium]|uniref:Cation antiporter n=1 Tax=Candidatus Contendobacter odensis Run_B_J11 TaxID=1400861 RepID=A0A7U7GAR5_9GAMM|nr:Na+/H+ antiporter subunit E [Candidatus Contendobacter odensis]MBK8534382.1 Na+/H+ antiporter subunit E [Candidatus Competibacteraceae bacterium]MBK8751836.1 Na+/H+ antiporter subunit E [Candidatus Competibacteraceae bacterium]CDH44705.1 putative Cation antiporter [Candidatus Contendobacter odensis Run_B_J11]
MTLISACLPRPMLSATLLAIWLLLQNSLALSQILLGSILAVAITKLVMRIWPEPVRLRRPGLLLRYLGRLLWDMVIANLEVARLILTRPISTLQPRFIELPLALQDEFAIAVLAATITLTPGTIAVDVTLDRRHLWIHCLDITDETALIATLKNRYEVLLKEMFA